MAQQHDVRPNQITDWKNQLLAKAADVFGGEPRPDKATVDLKVLHAKIGQLALENDFFEGRAHQGRHAERKAMIDHNHPLPITRQAKIANISRGSVYYESEPSSDADLKLMRRIDELHLELPFAGARMLRDLLRAEGFTVGRKHMITLMRRLGLTALYRKPNTSKKAPGHTIYPYPLRTLSITRSNHV